MNVDRKEYEAFFDTVGSKTISKSAQMKLLRNLEEWHLYIEQAVFDTINDAALTKGEEKFQNDYFEHVSSRIQEYTLRQLVIEMQRADIRLVHRRNKWLFTSNRVDEETALKSLSDLFPKHR